MHTNLIVVIAKQYIKKTFNTKGLFVLLFLFCALLFYTTISSWSTFKLRQDTVKAYQQKSRSSWESNPDKHPHRMAHFGSFVFRLQHPLSIFDSGIDTYVGNSIYLEAHKQNTANFSEAALSTSLVRFGDLNMAILLQLILPLIIFFMGYSSITQEREHGTLKIMYLQGATFKQIILGKGLGLFLITLLFLLPGFIALWIVVFLENNNINYEIICRGLLITTTYTLFFVILCLITVIISAISKNSNTALLSVLGGWLLFFIVIPKASLAVGSYLNPNITKIESRI